MSQQDYSHHPSCQISQLCESVTEPLWNSVNITNQQNCIALALFIKEEEV
jgi:hypothetical protein